MSSPFQNICSLRAILDLGDTQRQARRLISGPCMGVKVRFLSFNRTQSRAVTGPEETSSSNRAVRQSTVLEVWSRGCNLCPHSLSV